MKTENAYSLQCRISLCLGGWFSVKCRALYKLLGFFSNKVEMRCCLCLFGRAQGAVVLERALLLFPFIFWVTKKGLRVRDGSPFISWGLQSSWGGFGVCDPEPRAVKVACSRFTSPLRCEFFFTHLGVFGSWWTTQRGRHHMGNRITQNIWLYKFALDPLLQWLISLIRIINGLWIKRSCRKPCIASLFSNSGRFFWRKRGLQGSERVHFGCVNKQLLCNLFTQYKW